MKLETFTLIVISLVIIGGLGAAGYIALYAGTPAYLVINPERHHARMTGESSLEIYREFQIKEPVKLEIDRELIGTSHDPNGQALTLRATIASTHVHYDPGTYRNRRLIEIPPLPGGIYQLVSNACWRIGLRKPCLALPALELRVP